MADRTVSVLLVARADAYKRGLNDAAKATQKFGSDSAKQMKSVSSELNKVSTESTLVGGALLAMATGAVLASARFDKSMSAVAAVSNATAGEMDRLRDAAIEAGQATVFSASQAADAEAELARAGVSTADILSGALRGSLDLAAAGQLDLADAATISAQAMNIFKLRGGDVSHIADVLAAGANKSAADVKQLGDALRQGGLVADQTGLSLEDTVGALSAFADNALIGSDAGTSLKTMLQRLTPQSDEAKSAMDELGLKAYDASGNFVGLAQFAQNLKDSMKDLTPEARNAALGVIFGTDAVRGAKVLYALGADGVRDYTNAVNDQGAASRMAATQLDNLSGDWEQFTGSLETTFIRAGSNANDMLRDMTQSATSLVNFIGDLPAPILATGLAAATAGGAFFIAAPRVAAFNAALAETPALSKAAATGMKLLGPAFIIAAIAGAVMDIQRANEELRNLTTEMGDLSRALNTDFDSSALDTLRERVAKLREEVASPGVVSYFRAGVGIITGGMGEINEKAALLNQAEQDVSKFTEVLGEVKWALGVDTPRAIELLSQSGVGLAGSTKDIVTQVQKYVDSTQQGGAASQHAASAMDTLADSTLSAEDQLKALKDQWDATIGVLLGVSNAEVGAEAALDALVKSLKDNGNEWDINSEKGRNNVSAFNDLVDAAGRVRDAKLEEGASVDKANAAYRKYLERVKSAPGLTDAQRAHVQKLIDKYAELPKAKTTTLKADTSQALDAIDLVKQRWDAILNMPTAVLNAHFGVTTSKGPAKASGGYISGPGTSTSDSIPARLSDGEYVVKASSVSRYGVAMMDAINAGRFANGGLVGFATGGSVNSRSTPPWDANFRDQMRGDATLLAFDFTAYGQAVDRAKAALQGYNDAVSNLADARRRVNEAGTPQEQAAAMRDLAQAERDAADAKLEVAAADKAKADAKPTGKNILQSFKDRAFKLDNFRRNLAILAKRGLSRVIIQQLLDAGIDEGGQMAAAIVRDGNIAQLNATQAAINKDSAQLAFAYGPSASSSGTSAASSGSSGTTGSTSTSVVLSFENASKPIVLQVDGEQVWKALLKVKRSRGGASLGLS